MKFLSCFLAFWLVFALYGCVTSRQPAQLPSKPLGWQPISLRKEKPQLCAAIRGNGELVMSHFAALAALSERFGPFDGLAGGSSASISSFLYESILQNPAVWNCPGCNAQRIGMRISLLLKSLWEYLAVLADTDEARALAGLKSFLSPGQERSILARLYDDSPLGVVDAIGQLNSVLNSAELGDLVNPELRDMLSPLKVALRTYQAREAFAAIRGVGKFTDSDKRTFFRPGVLNFQLLARKLGRIGNFYAGYGSFYETDRMKAFLDRCSPLAAGWTWHELQGKQPSCVAEAHGLIERYRKRLLAREDGVYSRVQERIGETAHVLVATSVLPEPETRLFETGLQRYRNDDDFESFSFSPFTQIRYGYWGNPADLAKLARNPHHYPDLKTAKLMTLGSGPWQTALSYSPAEPGLARIRVIEGTEVASAAGWPDLAPVLALRNIGCQKVIYVTRQGEASKFAHGVARALGMNAAEDRALYDLDDPKSSFSLSLAQADAVWCTNWDAYRLTDGGKLEWDSYHGKLVRPRSSEIRGCGIRRGK